MRICVLRWGLGWVLACGVLTGCAGNSPGTAGNSSGTAGNSPGTAGNSSGTAGNSPGTAGNSSGTAGNSAGTTAGGGTGTPGSGGVSALAAEAHSAATGDIPDNQVFLTFGDPQAGYSMVYPEGWARRGSGRDVTFQERNNVIHVVLATGAPPTQASVAGELARQRAHQPSLTYGKPTTISLRGAPAMKVSYSTLSPPDPVTSKRVRLLVDRYVLEHAGKVVTLDLGTPAGVDNVDAYRTISRSFHWR